MALIDILAQLNIRPDGILGHSTGEIACGYADGCMTREETLLSAYWRGRSVVEGNLPEGAMAAVGKFAGFVCLLEPTFHQCLKNIYTGDYLLMIT